ncbi:MAG: PEP-CTERM sorting domain-containing protein [Rhodospirillales bacterium]|nr:PEP-CTERM sorting domain-containing protein [Acetobacter sp.]
MKKSVLFPLLTAALVTAAHTNRAAGLIGTSVNGSLTFGSAATNYFDPNNGFVPPGYLNTSGTTVSIASPAVEFGFADGDNTDTANFSAFQFTLEDTVTASASVSVSDNPFTMTFTDPAFSGLTLNKVTDFFPGGLTYSLVGSTITVHWAGGSVRTNDDYTSTFTLVAVPEPSGWAMVSLGAAGAGLVALRRRRTE